jgi:hypothetical protein
MKGTTKIVAAYAISSLIASLPVAWFFRTLYVYDNLFGRNLWIVMPLVAVFTSAVAVSLVVHFTKHPGLGFWRGGLAALLSLISCAALAHPQLVLAAILFVGWFVFILGGIVGWLLPLTVGPNYSPKRTAAE